MDMISLMCCTRRDNRSLDPDRLLQKGEGTASSTLRVADLGSAGPARTTAVATTLELQLQRYVLKCWQSVSSDCARNCNYNAGWGQFTSVQVRMRQLNHNALELKYIIHHPATYTYNVYIPGTCGCINYTPYMVIHM